MQLAWPFLKVVIAGVVISFSSWLATKKPALAGFIIALPISSVIALVFTYLETSDNDKATVFAKSIFVGVPLSLTFFIPFLVASMTRFPFWLNLALGFALLLISYYVHAWILGR